MWSPSDSRSLWKNMYFLLLEALCTIQANHHLGILRYYESWKEHRYFHLLVLNGKRDCCKGRIWCKRDWFLCPTSACWLLNQNHSLNLPTSSKARIFLFFFFKKAIKETQTRILFLGKCMCEKKVEAENQNMRE
jgi:hypothetical protein